MKLRVWVGVFFLSIFFSSISSAGFYTPKQPLPDVPDPAAFLGYELGERFTPHHLVVEYMELLAQASPRVQLEAYGRSYEGRPLQLLTISDPHNLSRAEDIKKTYAELTDPRRTGFDSARNRVRELPVAVWLSYNIHGNEASSTEAAMAAAYFLAAADEDELGDLLKDTVVLLDPCLNPDGRDRYVNWITSVVGSKPNPLSAAREHHEPWPGGRFNHYLFDLNRDWAWLTQIESRQRAKAYLEWMPQVHVDFHEMWVESTYFFFPPERPVHQAFPPQVMKWGRIFGRGNAEAFDARGWRYYTAEDFDLFYPGYGDSWPSFQGAVGMTYEQAGHGRAGIVYRKNDGTELTLTERADHHYVASLATIRTAAENREARLLDFYRFFEVPARPDPWAYLLPPGNDPPRTRELAELLMFHGAEVHETTTEIPRRSVFDYDGRPADANLPEGTYVVAMNQPRHSFLRAILEPEAAITDTMFYDVSAWSLPVAFGTDAYMTKGPLGSLRKLTSLPRIETKVIHPEAEYAFLTSWDRNGAAKAASRLLQHDVKVHFTKRSFETMGRTFSEGSLVVFAQDQNHTHSELVSLLEEAAETCGVDFLGVTSGLTDHGPDLGSAQIQRLELPRVALLADSPASPASVGPCWFLLDRQYDIPHALLQIDQISQENLKDFDVLVIPNDWSGGRAYQSALDSAQVAVIKDWVRRGGVYVGLGGGAFFAGRAGLCTTKPASRDEDLSEADKAEREKARKMETISERENRQRKENLPGTIFRVSVDPRHPLGFGYRGDTRVLKTGSGALDLGPQGSNVALFVDQPRVSGYASQENITHLEETPYLVAEPLGRGHVVLYVEDPNFRLFWYGLNRLFLNSLFFLPSL